MWISHLEAVASAAVDWELTACKLPYAAPSLLPLATSRSRWLALTVGELTKCRGGEASSQRGRAQPSSKCSKAQLCSITLSCTVYDSFLTSIHFTFTICTYTLARLLNFPEATGLATSEIMEPVMYGYLQKGYSMI